MRHTIWSIPVSILLAKYEVRSLECTCMSVTGIARARLVLMYKTKQKTKKMHNFKTYQPSLLIMDSIIICSWLEEFLVISLTLIVVTMSRSENVCWGFDCKSTFWEYPWIITMSISSLLVYVSNEDSMHRHAVNHHWASQQPVLVCCVNK